MGFEFKSDQPEQKMVDTKTTLSVNEPVVEDLTQPVFTEGEEEKLAIQFIEENELYAKFLLWCGLQDQLKKLNDSLDK
jgi:hypothetical protein